MRVLARLCTGLLFCVRLSYSPSAPPTTLATFLTSCILGALAFGGLQTNRATSFLSTCRCSSCATEAQICGPIQLLHGPQVLDQYFPCPGSTQARARQLGHSQNTPELPTLGNPQLLPCPALPSPSHENPKKDPGPTPHIPAIC